MDEMLLRAAINAITAEMETSPQDATLYKERGRLRRMIGDEAGAMADLRKAVEMNPSLFSDLQNGNFTGDIGQLSLTKCWPK